METLSRIVRRVWLLFRREEFNANLAAEMAFHREQVEKSLRSEGMAPDEARCQAVRQFGNDVRLRERSVERVEFRFETVIQDIRYGIRQLRNNPGFTVTAILVLGLGVGATTAIFSAVNSILFKSLPYPHPDRIMSVFEKKDGGARLPSFATFRGIAERSQSFDAMAAMKVWRPAMVGIGEPEFFWGQRVSVDYFRTLGVLPALGRDFQAADDQHHGANVLILSNRLWRRRFGADPNIIGRGITLETSRGFDATSSYTIIGVMPAGFENVLSSTAEVWAPLQYDASLPLGGPEWGHHLTMIARLKPGISKEQATSELDALLPPFGNAHAKGFDTAGGIPAGVILTSLHDNLIAGVKPALLAILGAVILVLLIACVNVTNLLLARAAQRRGEFAMRAALGAGRTRLLRQLVTESLLLALLGGLLGVAIAEIGVRGLVALSPPGLPRVEAIRVDTAVLVFAFIITTCIGLAVGLIPAIQSARSDPQASLKQSARQTAGGHQVVRRSLVVSEVALALVLLCSAGLLLRSLQRLFSVDPGFDATHLLTMEVQESGSRYIKDDDRARLFDEAREAVSHIPGVESAAFVNQLPLSGDYEVYGIEYEAFPHQDDAAFRYAVSPDYFETMRIPLRRGRFLNERDRTTAPTPVLISESLAKRRFHNLDPIGQRVRMGPDMGRADAPWAEIVGVIGDVKQLSLAVGEADAFYTSHWAWVDNVQTLVVRTHGDPTALVPAVRNAIWSIDKDVPLPRTATMESLVSATEAQRRFALILFEVFALAALLLAATGIYGVLSGTVNERTREIGVRAALGASRGDILSLIVQQGMRLTVLGVAIGLGGAVAASYALVTLLWGVSRLDPVTYSGVIAVLLAISAIACWVPAWRAAHVDPAITLRAE
ncbi:MAG TPA: ABC transporter permease [Terriglobales bacterium]|nr:ABC transporter permease [Terriglobales bacterium]